VKRWIVSFVRRINSLRYRGVFIFCLVTLGVSCGVIGTVLFTRWQADTAVRGEAAITANIVSRQLEQMLWDKRRTALLLRDALDKAPDLDSIERSALGKSAGSAIPDLAGSGLIKKRKTIGWWVPPLPAGSRELAAFDRELREKSWFNTLFNRPSGFVLSDGQKPLLVMLEPLQAPANRSDIVVTVFDIEGLIRDFFTHAFQNPPVVTLRQDGRVLYRSAGWGVPDRHMPVIERPVRTWTANGWVLQMQTRRPVRTVPRSWLNALLVVILLLAISAVSGMWWAAERLRQMATTDELTGLFNRRFFFDRWEAECERAKRYGRDLSVMMVDLNGFKRVNDLMGHAMGDTVLQMAAHELRLRLRRSDILARFGGDEFVVALPETGLAQAEQAAEKIRKLSIRIPWAPAEVGLVRMSAGVAQLHNDEGAQEVIQRADAQLYLSKGGSTPRYLGSGGKIFSTGT
jgi:diguanylate cyclase (GGDEF)-like protein